MYRDWDPSGQTWNHGSQEGGGGVYTQQTLSLTEYIIRNQNYSEWQLLSAGGTLLWSLAAAHSPTWSKMVPKLTIWNIQAALCPSI